jgi:hypothetical protein
MQQIKNWAATFSGPKLIMGDFNQTANSSVCTTPAMQPEFEDVWASAIGMGTASAYPDNPVSCGTRTRKSRLDYIFKPAGDASLKLRSASIPDTRDLSKPASRLLGTSDDLGVRPSDHNMVFTVIDLIP